MISFTITGAESIPHQTVYCRFHNHGSHVGCVMCTACRRPSLDPVASTTNSYLATGSFFFAISVLTPDLFRDPQLIFVTSVLVNLCAPCRLQAPGLPAIRAFPSPSTATGVPRGMLHLV